VCACAVTDLDLAALGLDLQSLVEVRDHAEAAAAVLDERDGIPPPALRVLRRVLRRHLESLQELHRLVPEVRHDRSIGAGELWINRSLPVNCSHVSGLRCRPPSRCSVPSSISPPLFWIVIGSGHDTDKYSNAHVLLHIFFCLCVYIGTKNL
jgi:hypothetical protein